MNINGKFREIASCTISELLIILNLNLNKVVVEVNGNIVELTKFKEFKLDENDTIEVISFVGGG